MVLAQRTAAFSADTSLSTYFLGRFLSSWLWRNQVRPPAAQAIEPILMPIEEGSCSAMILLRSGHCSDSSWPV
jgi:hypothetical protein